MQDLLLALGWVLLSIFAFGAAGLVWWGINGFKSPKKALGKNDGRRYIMASVKGSFLPESRGNRQRNQKVPPRELRRSVPMSELIKLIEQETKDGTHTVLVTIDPNPLGSYVGSKKEEEREED